MWGLGQVMSFLIFVLLAMNSAAIYNWRQSSIWKKEIIRELRFSINTDKNNDNNNLFIFSAFCLDSCLNVLCIISPGPQPNIIPVIFLSSLGSIQPIIMSNHFGVNIAQIWTPSLYTLKP